MAYANTWAYTNKTTTEGGPRRLSLSASASGRNDKRYGDNWYRKI
jgi:hypothetical protein